MVAKTRMVTEQLPADGLQDGFDFDASQNTFSAG
jgi:hypothetical protein